MLIKSLCQEDYLLDIILVVFITIIVFGLVYHPYFFGDELIVQRLAIQNDYNFSLIFKGLNTYKPRLISNSLQALLASVQAPRLMYIGLLAGCMIWINVLLYTVARHLLSCSRVMAWLLIATVLTSRYGMMLYFDYFSGLVELLSTALLLSTLLLAWLTWREKFRWSYAVASVTLASFTIFSHERYVAGLAAAGIAIVFAEWFSSSAKRRIHVTVWALSLGLIPLLLFLIANAALGTSSVMTGTAGTVVSLGVDTLWSGLTYCYNVFLGGNYGHEWLFGHYNHLHPMGKIMGWSVAVCMIAIATLACIKKGYSSDNRWLALSAILVALALIAIASLTGTNLQATRFMFPVGILVALGWIIILKRPWNYVAITLILATNTSYLLLGSHDSIANVYASRAANSLAGSLLGVIPNGRNGIIVGNSDDYWTVGGCCAVDMGTQLGDTFSQVNFKSVIRVDPYLVGKAFNPALYDFGLSFYDFGPHRTARYRVVSVGTAAILAGLSDTDKLPTNTVLGSAETWARWQWNNRPIQIDGAIQLQLGIEGWSAVPASSLDGRWLVYHARALDGSHKPMRLQVNWHAKKDNRFLAATIQVVYPNETWHSYATLLNAPPGADIGYVYATLHHGAIGLVEVKSIELK
jgi:hypothetical protein